MAATMAAGSLGARVVGGDDGNVGVARCDLSHDGPFAAIAVTATAEHHDESATRPHQRAHGRDGSLEGVRRVRIVDHAKHAAVVHDSFEPTRHRDVRRARHDGLGGKPARDGHPHGQNQIRQVVLTDQWRDDLQPPQRRGKRGADPARAERRGFHHHVGANRLAPGPPRHAQPGANRALAHAPAGLVVDEGDGNAVRPVDELLEQDGLGLEIRVHRAVVVEVVLGEVRQRGHAERATLESSLGQRVRRGLQNDVGGAPRAHLGEKSVQLQRPGGGERRRPAARR